MTTNGDILIADLIAAGVDPVLVVRVRAALVRVDDDAAAMRARRAADAAHKRAGRQRRQLINSAKHFEHYQEVFRTIKK